MKLVKAIAFFALTAVVSAAGASPMSAVGVFKKPELNKITDAFSTLKEVEKCGYYRGQWRVSTKWDDKKMSQYVESGYQKFVGETTTSDLKPATNVLLAVLTLLPPGEAKIYEELVRFNEVLFASLMGSKLKIAYGSLSSQSTSANVIVIWSTQTREFLTLGMYPFCE